MVDDLTGPQIASFLDEHVREMLSITPPESKHALDVETLRGPGITFWSVMDGGSVVGCGALKRLDVRARRGQIDADPGGAPAQRDRVDDAGAHHHRGPADGIQQAEPGDRFGRVLRARPAAVREVRVRVLRAIRRLPARPAEHIPDQDDLAPGGREPANRRMAQEPRPVPAAPSVLESYHMDGAGVWHFWSELPVGECRAGRRRLRAGPKPPPRPRRSLPAAIRRRRQRPATARRTARSLDWGKMAIMTSDADTVALLERALDQTAGLIAAIEPGQAGLATPCAGWDVRALVSHLAGQDLRNFLVAVRGEAPDWTAPDRR